MKKMFLGMVLAMSPLMGFAWGPDGHRIVGRIADQNLTDNARAQIALLLKDDLLNNGTLSHRKTLESVANWADEIKSTPDGKAKSPWHYRNNPVCEEEDGPCENGACIDQRIEAMIDTLQADDSSPLQKNEALKWLVHLVGDIHQPLHSGDNHDRGGNNVKAALSGMKTRGARNLHGVWDTEFVKLAKAGTSIGAQLAADFDPGESGLWMDDARQLAKKYGYEALPNFACNATPSNIIVLSKDYQNSAAGVVREQLKLAGLRLAATLNSIYE